MKCRFHCYRDKEPRKISNVERIKIVFFDMDGVLTDTISSWKLIHDYFGTSNKRSVNEYLKGEIDDLEFIRRDVLLWRENDKLARKETICSILNQVPIMKGAISCISFLRKRNIKTVIVSAGLDILANRISKKLCIDYVFANGIKNDEEGRLTGEAVLKVELKHKDKIVRKLARDLNIKLERCVAVGNSCFDISMFETCGMGIAFNPDDECVKESADIIIEGKDLSRLIPALKPFT
jgi:HAD superfamily PSPase-like hydrolase